MKASSLDTNRFRVRPGRRVNLRQHDPADTQPFKSKKAASGRLERDCARLVALQEKLYAHVRWSLLITFLAMDEAGKDSAIKHLMRDLNPQATEFFTFKRLSEEELDD